MQGQKTLCVSSTPVRLPRWCCSPSTGSTHWGSSPLLSNLVLTSLTTVIRIHMDCSRLWISSKVNALKSVNTWWNIGKGDIDFFYSSPPLLLLWVQNFTSSNESKILPKILKTEKAKAQNYEIDRNWMKLLFYVINYLKCVRNFVKIDQLSMKSFTLNKYCSYLLEFLQPVTHRHLVVKVQTHIFRLMLFEIRQLWQIWIVIPTHRCQISLNTYWCLEE